MTENYPQLKSDQNFRDLQAQLEGTENRITVARNRYIQAVQNYNVDGALVPHQLDGDDVRLQAEAELHGRERGGDFQAADRGFRGASGHRRRPPHAPGQRTAPAVLRPRPRPPSASARRLGQAQSRLAVLVGPRRAGRERRCRGAAAHGTRHGSYRHPVRRGGQAHRGQAGGSRGKERQPDRGADRADDSARGYRAIRHSGRGAVEARTQGRRRRRDTARRAKNDRRVRIEVGYGLEGALPDAIANRIIDETITPHFKQGDFDGGVEAGVDHMISVVNGEPLPEPDRKWEQARRPGQSAAAAVGRRVRRRAGCCAPCSGGCSVRSPPAASPAASRGSLSHLLPIGVGRRRPRLPVRDAGSDPPAAGRPAAADGAGALAAASAEASGRRLWRSGGGFSGGGGGFGGGGASGSW